MGRRKVSRNVYDIVQFKKMIGKGLVVMWNGVVINKKTISTEIKKIKDKILAKNAKSIGLTGYCNNGIIYIFNGYDRLLAINSISYADLKKFNIELDIYVNQYSTKLSKDDIAKINK